MPTSPSPALRRYRFEALAAEVYEPVQRYVRRRVDPDAIDDVVAETMLTLWRRLDEVPLEAPGAWAYGVARRQVANHRRSSHRRLRLVDRLAAEPGPAGLPDDSSDPDLEQALALLTEPDRELLRMWAWEQLDPNEIAVALGISPNAVSIRLHRAKKKLAENLASARKEPNPPGHSHRERTKERRS